MKCWESKIHHGWQKKARFYKKGDIVINTYRDGKKEGYTWIMKQDSKSFINFLIKHGKNSVKTDCTKEVKE
jgi:hypothetical protein